MTPPPTAASATAGTIAPPRPAPSRRPAAPSRPAPARRAGQPDASRRGARPRRAAVAAGTGAAALLARAFSGRRLILALAAALMGLVFLQVTLLRINTSTSADAEKIQLLKRDNAAKRALIAQMGAGRRVEDAAASLGMVMPAATEVCYLRIGRKANCPDGLAAVEGQADGSAGTTDGSPAESPDTQGTGDVPADPAAGTAPAPQEAPASPAPAPEPQGTGDPGGLSAGPGGGD